MRVRWNRWWAQRSWLAVLVAAGLAGCANVPVPSKDDPLESWNRGVYGFNDALDRAILKPTATAYQDYVPSLVRKGVSNFFNNIDDAWSTVNSVLQLKAGNAGENFTRFWVNTLFGLGGLLDVATEMKIPRHNEDFGQTLGYWGVGAGPYLVLPFLGPSTVRDTVAMPVDWRGDIINERANQNISYSLWALDKVDARANLLPQESLMEGMAMDKYVLIRDAYLQYRRNQVYDGEPPEPKSGGQPDGADGGGGAGADEDYYDDGSDSGSGNDAGAAAAAPESQSGPEPSAPQSQPQASPERETHVPGRINGVPELGAPNPITLPRRLPGL